MAVLHARGQLAIGQDFVHEGILGTTWTGRLLRETRVASTRRSPQLTGSAWITGRAAYVVDDADPFLPASRSATSGPGDSRTGGPKWRRPTAGAARTCHITILAV